MKMNRPLLAIVACIGLAAVLIWLIETPSNRVGASDRTLLQDPADATGTPTATPIPGTPVFMPLVAVPPPATATPTATPTETPTATPTPTLGPPLFSDAFDDPDSGWPAGQSKDNKWGYVDGEYQIYLMTKNGWYVRTPDLPGRLPPVLLPASYRVEAVAHQESLAPYTASFGLAFDLVPIEPYAFYLFHIDPDYMEYRLEKYVCTNPSDCWQVLIDWTFHPAINPLTERNHLRVDRIGSSIQLYINDVNVDSYVDEELAGEGRDAGLYAGSYDDVPAEARFDDFRVYKAQ